MSKMITRNGGVRNTDGSVGVTLDKPKETTVLTDASASTAVKRTINLFTEADNDALQPVVTSHGVKEAIRDLVAAGAGDKSQQSKGADKVTTTSGVTSETLQKEKDDTVKKSSKHDDEEENDGYLSDDPEERYDAQAKSEAAQRIRFAIVLLILIAFKSEATRVHATLGARFNIWRKDLNMEIQATTKFQELTASFLNKKQYCRLQVTFERASDTNFMWKHGIVHTCIDGKRINLDWQHPVDPAYVKARAAEPLLVEVLFKDHKFEVWMKLVWRGQKETSPGIWRFPARLAKRRPGVASAIAEVVQRHEDGGSGNFDRLSRNLATRLRKFDKEENYTDARAIMETTTRYFKEAFDETPGSADAEAKLQWMPRAVLEEASAEVLAKDLKEEEVKKAIRELANDKSPGRAEGVVSQPLGGVEGMRMVREFVATDKLPDVTVLMYNKGAKTDVKNYRPITLLTSIYKILTKVVATRMKAILHQVISGEQYGFLTGRRLTDAVPMMASLIDTAKHKHKDWYLMMVDFKKAYDSVRGVHDEDDNMYGLPTAFRMLDRGPPQMVEERKLGIGEKGCERVTYVGYVDDTTLLLNGEQQLKEAHKMLREYAVMSGLKVNVAKSAILPLGKNINKPALAGLEYKWVGKDGQKGCLEAVGVLSRWQSKYLTTEVRVTIINSYVLPVFLFQAQMYPPDDLLWKKVETLLENFISANHANTEKHFRLWSGGLMYAPGEQGGLGVIDPRGRIDSIALRCVGLALIQGCPLRRRVTESAPGLALWWATLYTHKAVLKGGMI
ncbi:unnamed protein product [Closterium sp. Yama58-4]|nr:unnamed protein product [Closterium sp. Yama58-4]